MNQKRELSIEEKAKAYDEALKVANKYKDTHIMFPSIQEEMFPELTESEDEKVRKMVLKAFKLFAEKQSLIGHCLDDIDWDKCIAYLEKQGEQKPTIIPKFRVGDIIEDETGVWPHKKIEAIEHENYVVRCLYTNSKQYIPISTQDEYKLVEQKIR